jgi:hypothetical protein
MEPTVQKVSRAMKPAVEKVIEFGTLAGKRVRQIEDDTCEFIRTRCGETAGAVARKVADVLPEITAMLALFAGFTILPLGILAVRSVFCFSDSIKDLFRNDVPAAREHALEAVKKMSERFMNGAIATSFATAGILGLAGIGMGSLSLIARGGVFLCLGLAGMNRLLPPAAEEREELEAPLSAVSEEVQTEMSTEAPAPTEVVPPTVQ